MITESGGYMYIRYCIVYISIVVFPDLDGKTPLCYVGPLSLLLPTSLGLVEAKKLCKNSHVNWVAQPPK